jgi:hypothetical protein
MVDWINMNFTQKTLTFFKLAQNRIRDDWQAFVAILALRVYLVLWVVGVIANLVFTYLIVKNSPQENINLHYNILFGTDLIGPPIRLYFLPLTGFLLGLLNMVLAMSWLKKDHLLSYLAVNSAIVINVFMALGIYATYLINFVNIKF